MSKSEAFPIYLATANRHKLTEIRQMVKGLPLKILGGHELGPIQWEENGQSFHENALIKAQAFAAHTDQAVLADDSGLVVPALGGAPGIHSSRYAGEQATDQENMAKLIRQLENLAPEERGAYFVCVLCFRDWQGEFHYFEGRCEGQLLLDARGQHGFGYDPIFQPHSYQQTMAELPAEAKNAISHRRRALDQWLKQLTLPNAP